MESVVTVNDRRLHLLMESIWLASHEERQFISTIVSLLSDVEQTFDDLGRQAAKARSKTVNALGG
jgi:hypothetical protein